MPEAHTPVSISSSLTTVGTGVEYMQLVENGAAPAENLSIPDGTQLVISDVAVCGAPLQTVWQMEQSNDNGDNWFEIGIFAVPGVNTTPTTLYSVRTGWVLQGNSVGVLLRFGMHTQGGGGGTGVLTVRGYRCP